MDELVRGVRWLVECHRTWIFFGFLGTALAAGTLAVGVRIDTRISGLLLSGDPELRQTEALKQDFSNDEVLLVVAELDLVTAQTHEVLRLRTQDPARVSSAPYHGVLDMRAYGDQLAIGLLERDADGDVDVPNIRLLRVDTASIPSP